MNNLLNLSILPAIVAALLSFIATPFVIKLAKKIDIIDDPAKNRHPKVIHDKPTPRGGGLAIFVGVFVASIAFLPFDKHLVGILAGALLAVVVGLLDDKYDLNPYIRLLLGFVIAGLPIAAGIGIAFISNPLTGQIIDLSHPRIVFDFLSETRSIWVLSDIFGLLWLVFLMNMLNMGAKGIDGQLTGTIAIAAIVIALLLLRFSADITQWEVIILASITGGAFLGFLPWHIYPQKIMPSYGGALLGGFLLGILSILSTTKVGVLFVALGVPLVDTGYTIIRRVIKGKSPVWGDRGHLHHRLLDAGLSKMQVTLFYWGGTLLLGLLALYLNSSDKLYTILGVSVAVGGLLLWLTYKPK
jgi:UDP-GlcNAc:undecaprenyl-phosphate GlcNAc-1-phosphate transferase